VLSPPDNPVDVRQKVREYFESGARLVWVIAPAARIATAYRADGSIRLLRAGDHLDGEDVLPGLLIPLAELFD
jgi:Uma2 family endonuclease